MRIWVQISSTYIKAKHGCTCLWPQHWRMDVGRLWELVSSWAPCSVSQRNRIDICRRQPVFSSGLHVCAHSHVDRQLQRKKEGREYLKRKWAFSSAEPYCSFHQRPCVGGLWSLLSYGCISSRSSSGCPHTGPIYTPSNTIARNSSLPLVAAWGLPTQT